MQIHSAIGTNKGEISERPSSVKNKISSSVHIVAIKNRSGLSMDVPEGKAYQKSNVKASAWRSIRQRVQSLWTLVNIRVYRAWGKRVFDIVGGSLLLILFSPILGIAWLAVRFTSRGVGIFSQERIGLHGKPFVFYKLRSMYDNQESRVNMEKVKEGEANGLLYKPKDDPRVTPVGWFIRKTSIDELPQFWSVICGNMSLVGPRPLVPHMLAPYPEIMAYRSQVRPGISGQWQVSARKDNISVLGMVKHDDYYINNYSMTMDLWILFKTPFVVMHTRGAQ